MTSDVVLQSKAISSVANNSSSLGPCSRRTQSFDGIDDWSPISGNTPTAKIRNLVDQRFVDLTVKFAKENPTWGYDRISGALSNVGYHLCDSTLGNILKAHGIEPAPDRKRTGSWETFLEAHWDVMASIDFTPVEVWTKGGLTTIYLLFVMELKTRRVAFAGCTTNPNEAWMKTVALELTNHEDGLLNDKKEVLDHGS